MRTAWKYGGGGQTLLASHMKWRVFDLGFQSRYNGLNLIFTFLEVGSTDDEVLRLSFWHHVCVELRLA